MDKNKFKYCTLLLINDYNHSKIFISPKNKYYIRDDNKSIHVKNLNKFKDIRKFNEINVSVEDITDNYYKTNKSCIIRHCTVLSIDDNNHSRIFISEKTIYYTSYDYNDYHDYYDDDYDDDHYDDHYDDDDDAELVSYNKPLNDFERLVSVKNNIVNLVNNDNYRHKIASLVNDFEMLICETDIY